MTFEPQTAVCLASAHFPNVLATLQALEEADVRALMWVEDRPGSKPKHDGSTGDPAWSTVARPWMPSSVLDRLPPPDEKIAWLR